MITFGEKAALDAYHDFCVLQQGLIEQLTKTIAVLSSQQVAFSVRPPAKPEFVQDLEYRAKETLTAEQVEDLIKEANQFNATKTF